MQIPSSLIKSLIGLKGFQQESFEQVHASPEQVTSIRWNPCKKVNVESENSKFNSENSKTENSLNAGLGLPTPDSRLPGLARVPWSTNGYYLSKRPSFTFDPLFHAGCYYVQEASSMFLEEAFKQTVDITADIRVLDLCAAPGGKSTLLQSIISSDSLLVSNEVIKSRAGILEENITKWGGANVIVTNNDPADFTRIGNFFDAVVIDAPCSGSGLFRRDPEAIAEWSEQNVQLCSQRQQRIIADVWPALKKNGILIYSTCSYSELEDEDILDWMIKEFALESLALQVKPEWNIIETISTKHCAYGYRFWPDKVKGEGFFIACLRKTDGEENSEKHFRKTRIESLNKLEEAIVRPWLKKEVDIQLFKLGDSILALPKGLELAIQEIIAASLYMRLAGVRIGKIAGKDFIPDHAVAVSDLVSSELVAVSLNHEQAIQYLRKEEVPLTELRLTEGKEKLLPGWALVQFEEVNIGWIKILQNRINNYYPKDWRVLKR